MDSTFLRLCGVCLLASTWTCIPQLSFTTACAAQGADNLLQLFHLAVFEFGGVQFDLVGLPGKNRPANGFGMDAAVPNDFPLFTVQIFDRGRIIQATAGMLGAGAKQSASVWAAVARFIPVSSISQPKYWSRKSRGKRLTPQFCVHGCNSAPDGFHHIDCHAVACLLVGLVIALDGKHRVDAVICPALQPQTFARCQAADATPHRTP